MTTTTSPVLLNAVANVECESSLAAAAVSDPMLPEHTYLGPALKGEDAYILA